MRLTGRLVIGVLLALELLVPATAAQESVAADPDILKILGGYEWHGDAAMGQVLPQGATKELMAIATDQDLPAHLRPRAIAVLSMIASEEVWGFFLRELEQSSGVDRRRMVEALCSGFAGTKAHSLAAILGPYLDANDAHLRVITVRCLGGLVSPAAKPLIRAYGDRVIESGEAWERQAFEAMRRIDDR